jgi:hypothetical protein
MVGERIIQLCAYMQIKNLYKGCGSIPQRSLCPMVVNINIRLKTSVEHSNGVALDL